MEQTSAAAHVHLSISVCSQGFDVMPIHDMLVTEHWYIVLLGPVKVGGVQWECSGMV